MNTSDKEDQIPIDFGTVYEFVNVTGIHSLSWRQWSCTNTITSWRNKTQSQSWEIFFSQQIITLSLKKQNYLLYNTKNFQNKWIVF